MTDAKEELEEREGQNAKELHKAMHDTAKNEALLVRERQIKSEMKAKVGFSEMNAHANSIPCFFEAPKSHV